MSRILLTLFMLGLWIYTIYLIAKAPKPRIHDYEKPSDHF
jgi:hypothetical protein